MSVENKPTTNIIPMFIIIPIIPILNRFVNACVRYLSDVVFEFFIIWYTIPIIVVSSNPNIILVYASLSENAPINSPSIILTAYSGVLFFVKHSVNSVNTDVLIDATSILLAVSVLSWNIISIIVTNKKIFVIKWFFK